MHHIPRKRTLISAIMACLLAFSFNRALASPIRALGVNAYNNSMYLIPTTEQILDPYSKISGWYYFSLNAFGPDIVRIRERGRISISKNSVDTTSFKQEVPNGGGAASRAPVLPDEPEEIVGDLVSSEADATDCYKRYIFDLTSTQYTNVDPYIIFAIIEHESNWTVDAVNKHSGASGLMQLVPKYYRSRMKELGYTDILEPYANIHLGVDSISSMLNQYKDPALVLMLYSSKWNTAFANYRSGHISKYASSIIARAEELRNGEGNG